MTSEDVIAKGNCERIGIGGLITHKLADGTTIQEEADFPTHTEAFVKLVELLTTGDKAVVTDLSEIAAVGHRIVQGGKYFSESVLATDEVIDRIESISDLAPLHNPAHVQAIRACQKVFPAGTPQVVVFDTAFHQTMPPKAYMYGLPYEYYEKYQVRKYGFHGTSHRFVTARLAELIGGVEGKKVVTCHLGNGSSIAAVDNGKCVDTTMGFTPLDGLVMGTRSGAVDPSVILYIMKHENLTPDEMSNILNKQSGFLGMSGVTSDSRDLIKASEEGSERSQETIDKFRYQIRKYIGSYAAAMGGLDAVVFTGGIGENSDELRHDVCTNMEVLGIHFDDAKNVELNRHEGKISKDDSKVQVWIIPTNEELLIARDTKHIVEGMK